MIQKKNNRLEHYILLILGITLFVLFIWFRFIRQRLPREVPFHPKFLGFILLLFICCSYLYAIIVTNMRLRGNKQLNNFFDLIYKPLNISDDLLKHLMPQKLQDYFFSKWTEKLRNPKRIILIYSILPKIVLLTVFSLDLYYFQKLHYIYNVIFFTFFTLWSRYKRYSLKKFLDYRIQLLSLKVSSVMTDYVYGVHPSEWPENLHLLDPEDDDDYIEKMALPLDIFIKYQTTRIINSSEPSEYYTHYTKEYYAEYKKEFNITRLKSQDHDRIDASFLPQIEKFIASSVILANYNKINHEDYNIRKLKTLIFLNYLLAWLFILIISLPHTHWLDIVYTLLNTVYTENNPFSGHRIF